MRKSFAAAVSFAIALLAAPAFAAETPGLGQKVTEGDLALWDISIGPDGKGLPPGSGTPAEGAPIFAQKCELCHGKEGKGAISGALVSATERTMASYVPNATTMFDFVRRAMPWPQPKSLTNEEVYALTAYILALNKIIGENDAMDAQTLPKVQMPNRDGFISRYPEKH